LNQFVFRHVIVDYIVYGFEYHLDVNDPRYFLRFIMQDIKHNLEDFFRSEQW